MALIYIDGFDTYQTADLLKRWTDVQLTPTIGSGGRTGQACQLGNSESISKGLPAVSAYIVGFAYKPQSFYSSSVVMCSFVGASFDQMMLCVLPTGALRASVATANHRLAGVTEINSTALYTTGGGILSADTWSYIEVRCLLSASVGEFEVRVNGVPVIETTDLSTRDTSWSDTNIYAIDIGGNTTSGGASVAYVDDVYICDTSGSVNNDFLGDVTVEAIFPQTDAVSPGSNADFTCSAAADHGALVDESATDFPDEDTTYVYSSTIGHIDSYHYPDITPVSADIKGVQVNICAKKSTTGTRTYKSVAKLAAGATTEGATAYAPSDTSYAYGCDIWEAKPGGGAWTVSDVNGAEFGVTVEA